MSEIEVPARPRSLNSRLAPSSSRERIWRPAERVARAACLGSPAGVSGVVGTDLGAICPLVYYLYDIQTNMSTDQAPGWAACRGKARPPFSPARSLASPPKILINRASVDPGRELNGRSQQSLLPGVFDVAGPVGPSSRASAF